MVDYGRLLFKESIASTTVSKRTLHRHATILLAEHDTERAITHAFAFVTSTVQEIKRELETKCIL